MASRAAPSSGQLLSIRRGGAASGMLLLLFFLSGATALVYEVLWMRRLTLVFGASQLAIATVLGAFMTGLALGARVGGRYADRGSRLLLVYALLEFFIAAYALAFPWLSDLLVPIYRALVSAEAAEFWFSRVVHLVLMGGLLLAPTAAMGATLPLLLRLAADRMSGVGTWLGLLYGANTLGAVAGTLLAGFFLLPNFGVRASDYLAAGANIAVALAALALVRALPWADRGRVLDDREEQAERRAVLEVQPDPDLHQDRLPGLRKVLPWLLLGSGFCAMVFEVAWSRLLGLILGSSTYAFTLMLTAFLLGTALGAPSAAVLLRRRAARPMRWLAAALALAALTAWVSHLGFGQLPFWYVDLWSSTGGRDDLIFPMKSVIAMMVMTPPTFFLGMALPLALAVFSREPEQLGVDVARLYLYNTGGAVLGALGAGFVLLPLLGIRRTLVLAVLVLVGLALWTLLCTRVEDTARRLSLAGLSLLGLLALLVRPQWDPLILSAGMYKYVSDLSDYSHEAVRNYALSDFELLYYAEGAGAVVTVARSQTTGNVWLANNGKVDASSQADLRTQLLLGHLPFLHRAGAESALVVGLGSGITAGAVTVEESLGRIDVLEIEPDVVVASRFFDEFNGRPLEDPRVRMLRNDARNHLVLSDHRYDVIINEPSNPWISGVANLFTEEFLELGVSRLADDGVFCQWLQTYGMSRDDLRSLLKTFATVFPEVLLYQAPGYADVLLIGSRKPLSLQSEAFWSVPGRAEDLARIEARTTDDLLAYARLDRPAVIELAGDVALNTDDNVRIEFSAPLHLHYDTSGSNEALISSHSLEPRELRGLMP